MRAGISADELIEEQIECLADMFSQTASSQDDDERICRHNGFSSQCELLPNALAFSRGVLMTTSSAYLS